MTLRSYILYQHHHCQVTQPLLHEQLREWGIDISTGAIDAILTSDHDRFHAEKDALLERGLGSARYVTVDDSGARHQGRNGYVTQIGNAFFAWFCSTSSKSRINFLTLLCAGVDGGPNPPLSGDQRVFANFWHGACVVRGSVSCPRKTTS